MHESVQSQRVRGGQLSYPIVLHLDQVILRGGLDPTHSLLLAINSLGFLLFPPQVGVQFLFEVSILLVDLFLILLNESRAVLLGHYLVERDVHTAV